jgi:hypothetical protein
MANGGSTPIQCIVALLKAYDHVLAILSVDGVPPQMKSINIKGK